jgi:hypothetical protein
MPEGVLMQFNREDVKRWRRAVHKELRWCKLPSDDAVYRAAMVASGIYCFGTNLDVLVEVTGQDRKFVRDTLKHFRSRRVLVGQTLRIDWNDPKSGAFALLLDAMVGAGEIDRPPDPKRSAAQRARKSSGERKPYRKRTPQPQGVFTPKVTKADPLYGLNEWRQAK